MSQDARDDVACFVVPTLVVCVLSTLLGVVVGRLVSEGGLFAAALEDGGGAIRGVAIAGEHDRPSRRRKPAVRPEPKRRWRRILSAGGP